MTQHDNGRRPAGHQGEAWQQGHQGQPDYSAAQQDQSAGGRYGGQHGGHRESGGFGGHQNQYESGRQQHGDNWRDRPSPRGGYRPGPDERDSGWIASRGGQGSFGGQASDNDYGNRGITESGNFGNYGGRDTGSARQRGEGDRHGEQVRDVYRHGYDPRSDAGYPDVGRGGDEERWRGREGYSTYGQSSADRGRSIRGGRDDQWPDNRDRYGERGYQGNWQAGDRGQSYHEPEYRQWRDEQLRQLDRDYDEWRQHRYQRFSDEFRDWRSSRAGQGQESGDAAASGARTGAGSKPDVTPGTGEGAKSSETAASTTKGQAR